MWILALFYCFFSHSWTTVIGGPSKNVINEYKTFYLCYCISITKFLCTIFSCILLSVFFPQTNWGKSECKLFVKTRLLIHPDFGGESNVRVNFHDSQSPPRHLPSTTKCLTPWEIFPQQCTGLSWTPHTGFEAMCQFGLSVLSLGPCTGPRASVQGQTWHVTSSAAVAMSGIASKSPAPLCGLWPSCQLWSPVLAHCSPLPSPKPRSIWPLSPKPPALAHGSQVPSTQPFATKLPVPVYSPES